MPRSNSYFRFGNGVCNGAFMLQNGVFLIYPIGPVHWEKILVIAIRFEVPNNIVNHVMGFKKNLVKVFQVISSNGY